MKDGGLHPACGLEVVGLSGGYAGHAVLHGLSFTVQPGECLVVLGCNGSGKSTLLKGVAGLLPTHSGTVRLDGRDLGALSGRARARLLAYSPQQLEFAESSVFEAVLSGRIPYLTWGTSEQDLSAVRKSLVQTHLTSLANRPVQELSGGECRRVGLARALAQSARALLLDEPTSGLDLHAQFETVELLREIVRAEKLCALVTLHDLNLALRLGDRFLILKEGTARALGGREIFTASLLSEVFGVEAAFLEAFPNDTTPTLAFRLPTSPDL